ncbi:MAG: hypothetical protein A2X08_03580 [Bacteroidetes bacterium GWA2_32_17]|nr:MAG: hypothetical protein A2X08_03580 [Bacteroidetes bacterium GWA2_32_17]
MLNKHILLIFLLIGFSFYSFSQTDSLKSNIENKKKYLVFNISVLNDPDLSIKDGITLSTVISLKSNKNLFQIGPLWWFDQNRNANFFKGGIFSYNYFPFKENRLNFYFILDFAYVYKNDIWSKEMKYNPISSSIVDYKSKWQSLKNQIGYGFIIKIYKRIYINQSFSIGGEFYNYKSKTIVRENADYSNEYKSGNIFSKFESSYFIKTGIGYSFE